MNQNLIEEQTDLRGRASSGFGQVMLVPKIFYFFNFAALAAVAPYLALYYQRIGLSGRQIGLLVGLPPLMTLVSAPLFGAVADATQRHKRLLILAVCCSATAMLSISFTNDFLTLIPIVVLYALSFAPVVPLVDKTVLELLGERKELYGKQRLWGAIGWGVTAPLIGLLLERLNLHWAFYIYFVLMIGVLLTVSRLPVSQADIRTHFWQGLRALVANRQWVVFLAVVFTGGVGMAFVHNYLFLYLDELGASSTTMGLALASATVSELLVMFYSDRLLARWGTRGLLILAIAAFIVRVFAYSFIRAPWLVLIVQLLHGPSFAAMWMAGVTRASKLAPPGMKATAQGIFSGVTMGVGSAFGAFVGGALYEAYGAATMYQWAGFGMLIGLVYFLLAGKKLDDG